MNVSTYCAACKTKAECDASRACRLESVQQCACDLTIFDPGTDPDCPVHAAPSSPGDKLERNPVHYQRDVKLLQERIDQLERELAEMTADRDEEREARRNVDRDNMRLRALQSASGAHYEMIGFETGDKGRVVAECPKCHHTAPLLMTREQFMRAMLPADRTSDAPSE